MTDSGIDLEWLQSQFSDIHLMTLLSKGGQKIVYAATHQAYGAVVLKLILPGEDPEHLRREILAVQQIGCPTVPPILVDGVLVTPWGKWTWVIEQRINGTTVRALLEKGALPPLAVMRMGRDVLRALALAESAGIVHRDVKPDNLIIDHNEVTWLLDFGLARHLTLVSATATALPFGKMTLGYAPREQSRNDKPAIDARADLFALGVTMYECFTGTHPFRMGARDAFDVMQRTETRPLVPLNLALRNSRDIWDFISALTQKRRDHRPRSAADALAWINDLCAVQGI